MPAPLRARSHAVLCILALTSCQRSAAGTSFVDIELTGSATATTTATDATTSTTDASTDPGTTTTAPLDSSTTDVAEATTATTAVAPPCDDDPACGPDEDLETCPSQCSVCGDAIVSGREACDNGENNSPAYNSFYDFPPLPGACTYGCKAVEWCGDGVVNGPEPCDEGGIQTPDCEVTCKLPSCGDGQVNHAIGEACDDFNHVDGDGCTADCAFRERRVFITSLAYHGDFDHGSANPGWLTGLALADYRCQTRFDYVDFIDTPAKFKAWLSDDESSPSTRFDTTFDGHYRLLTGDFPIVATGWPDLVDGTLDHAIDHDEFGAYVNFLAWSNTRPDGTAASPTDHCKGWTSRLPTLKTSLGATSLTTTAWTDFAADKSCSGPYRVYCVEDI